MVATGTGQAITSGGGLDERAKNIFDLSISLIVMFAELKPNGFDAVELSSGNRSKASGMAGNGSHKQPLTQYRE